MKQCNKTLTCAGGSGVIEFFFSIAYLISIFLCKGSCPWYDKAYENIVSVG